MPLGGETVGTAYIRILADGGGLDESIRRQYKEADPTVRSAGERHGDEYDKAFFKRLHEHPMDKEFQKLFADAMGQQDANAIFRQGSFRQFQRDLERNYGALGRRLGQDLDRELARGMTGDQLRNRLRNLTGEIAKMGDAMESEAHSINRAFNTETQRRIDRQNAAVGRLRNSFEFITAEVDRFAKGEQAAGGRGDLLRHIRNLDILAKRAGHDTAEWTSGVEALTKRLIYANPHLERAQRGIGRFADRAGAAFGRGSRNNFINFFGSVVRGFLRIGEVPLLVLNKMSDAFNHVRGIFQKVSESAGGFASTLSTIGIVSAEVVGGLVLFGAALAALALLIGPIVALLSGLLGIVIALASTIGAALVAAIGAAVGALAPLAAGIATVVFALSSMTKAQKTAFRAQVRPLTRQIRELGGAVRQVLIRRLGQDLHDLAGPLGTLRPLLVRIARAIGDVGHSWAQALHGPGFRNFIKTMEKFLPDAIRSLGRSFRNVVGGMGGVLVALIPITRHFLHWLERITKEFDNWANSKRGRRALTEFFAKAEVSLHRVWNLLVSVGHLIGTLFSGGGQKTGDSIFKSMTDGINNLNKAIKKNPHGLRDFFKNAKQTADDIGKIADALVLVSDALDTDATRTILHFFDALAAIAFGSTALGINLVGNAIKYVADEAGRLKNFKMPSFGGFGGGKAPKINLPKIDPHYFGNLFGGIDKALLNALDFVTSPRIVHAIGRAISGAGRGIARAWHQMLHGAFSGGLGNFLSGIGHQFSRVGGAIGKALGNVPGAIRKHIGGNLRGIAGTAVNFLINPFHVAPARIAAFVSGAPGRIRAILSRLPGIGRIFSGLLSGAFRAVTGRIGGFVSGVPGRIRGILSALGSIGRTAASAVAGAFTGIVGRIAGHFAGIGASVGRFFSGMASAARTAASNVVSAFVGLGGRILKAIGSVIIHPQVGSIIGSLNPFKHASGGLFEGPRGVGVPAIIGEAGQEAVVPLDRPLSQVDPSVRWLSAIAQGKMMASGGVGGGGKSLTVTQNIYTPNADSRAVASETVNRLAVVGAY